MSLADTAIAHGGRDAPGIVAHPRRDVLSRFDQASEYTAIVVTPDAVAISVDARSPPPDHFTAVGHHILRSIVYSHSKKTRRSRFAAVFCAPVMCSASPERAGVEEVSMTRDRLPAAQNA